MKVFAMNCPNCNGKLQAGEKSGYLTCEHCGSSIFIEKENSDLPDESDEAEEVIDKRLKLLLNHYQLRISNYHAKGVYDPYEVQSINDRFFNSIMALSPDNKRAKKLRERLSKIDFDGVDGTDWYLLLKQNGFLSIIDNGSGIIIFNQPLEKVVILKVRETIPRIPILGLPVPGKIVFQNPDDPDGKTIDFKYPGSSEPEVFRLIHYISKVARITD